MKKYLLVFSVMIIFLSNAQTDSLRKPLSVTAYVEMYYQNDFENSAQHSRPSFIYSHHRNNEFNLNLGLIKADYQTENMRANFALGAGTYMNANYASEENVLKNIYEANVGVKLLKNKSIWLDVGVMPSHIGWESAIGKDNFTLTRSIAAENSPYFETGAKLSYSSKNGKWYIAGLLLNGWQRIQRVEGNNSLAFGHQLAYKVNEKLSLNSSSFIGNDKPDSIKQVRYFHNFYGQVKWSKKFRMIAGFDVGAEQIAKSSKSYAIWYSPVLIGKYSFTEKSSVSGRVEYYQDKKVAMISTKTPEGFQTWGVSLNYDYQISPNVLWRLETKNFSSKDPIFESQNEFKKSNFNISTSLAVSF